jgi:serpin B
MEDFEQAGPDKHLVQVPMMHQKEQFPYTENDLCQAVKLPYGNGAYTMTLLLPREGKQVSDVLNTLTAETWRSNYQYMGIANVDLKLPRFETKTDLNLIEIMSSLGMPNAFIDGLAEFPNFCDAETYIELMKQVARIKLNETGTEAAAVTVIGMGESAFEEPPVIKDVVLHANRPFLYVISEQSTGTIFFIGQFMGTTSN